MSKKVLFAYQWITNGDMSQAEIQSAYTSIAYLDNISVQVKWTGTSPVGVLRIVGSVNGEDFVVQPISAPPVNANSGNVMISFQNAGYQKVGLLYQRTSGSGTMNSWIGGKEV